MVALAKGLIAAVGCAGLLASGPAAASASVAATSNYSPWASLSAFASPVSSQALCGSAVASAAASAAAQAAPGCVLPAVDPVPVPVVQSAPVAVPVAASGGGIGILPLLLGLAALAGLAALLLGNNDDDDDTIVARPISPA